MQVPTTDILQKVFSEVLANLAFMFPDDSKPELNPEHEWLETTIRYEGPHVATLRLWCTRPFSILLALNLLDVDPRSEDSAPKGEDAVKELINVLGGQLVTTLHGTQDVFSLTIPEIRLLPQPPDETVLDGSMVVRLSIENHSLCLAYQSVDR